MTTPKTFRAMQLIPHSAFSRTPVKSCNCFDYDLLAFKISTNIRLFHQKRYEFSYLLLFWLKQKGVHYVVSLVTLQVGKWKSASFVSEFTHCQSTVTRHPEEKKHATLQFMKPPMLTKEAVFVTDE